MLADVVSAGNQGNHVLGAGRRVFTGGALAFALFREALGFGAGGLFALRPGFLFGCLSVGLGTLPFDPAGLGFVVFLLLADGLLLGSQFGGLALDLGALCPGLGFLLFALARQFCPLGSQPGLFGGAGVGNLGQVVAEEVPWHGQPYSALVTLPKLGGVWFEPADESAGPADAAVAAEPAVRWAVLFSAVKALSSPLCLPDASSMDPALLKGRPLNPSILPECGRRPRLDTHFSGGRRRDLAAQ